MSILWGLWLDDYRPIAPSMNLLSDVQHVFHARDFAEFKLLIQQHGCPKIISFDHDLADQHYAGDYSDENTGYDCAKWFGNWLLDDPSRLIVGFRWSVHSQNPVGAENIELYMRNVIAEVKSRGAVGNSSSY